MKKLITSCAFLTGCLFYSPGKAQSRFHKLPQAPAQTRPHVQTMPGTDHRNQEKQTYNGQMPVVSVPDTYAGHLLIKTPDKKNGHLRIIPPADAPGRKKPRLPKDPFDRKEGKPEEAAHPDDHSSCSTR